MKTSSKIWLAIAGVLLIVLGVVCICRPAATLFTAAWIIGCITLLAGISKLIFVFRTRFFLPNSGSRALSALLEIILGIIFLANSMFLTATLPVIFAMWILIEGVIIAVQSFDYKTAGFSFWWILFVLGLAGAVLGCLGLRNPDVSAVTLSTFIGIGVIVLGVAYLLALIGINKFEKKATEIQDSFKSVI